jgi:hypothetical protein
LIFFSFYYVLIVNKGALQGCVPAFNFSVAENGKSRRIKNVDGNNDNENETYNNSKYETIIWEHIWHSFMVILGFY